MIMTQFAMMDPGPAGDSLFSRCCRGIAHFFGFGDTPTLPTHMAVEERLAPPAAPQRPVLHLVPPTAEIQTPVTDFKWRRHEQLRQPTINTLSNDERQGRHQAVRGLYAARAGEIDKAERLFASAAQHAAIDLSEIPGFWSLPRTAMMSAVTGYEKVGRLREASALSARIRVQFRPRALPTVPANVTELPSKRTQLTGNS